jgi:hypothetical protein
MNLIKVILCDKVIFNPSSEVIIDPWRSTVWPKISIYCHSFNLYSTETIFHGRHLKFQLHLANWRK